MNCRIFLLTAGLVALVSSFTQGADDHPNIVVITGALGPTIDLSGTNAYDLL